MKTVIKIEVGIALLFWVVVVFHHLTPESWAWLTEKQLKGASSLGIIWSLMAVYHIHKLEKS